jgi:hypothetical protein
MSHTFLVNHNLSISLYRGLGFFKTRISVHNTAFFPRASFIALAKSIGCALYLWHSDLCMEGVKALKICKLQLYPPNMEGVRDAKWLANQLGKHDN